MSVSRFLKNLREQVRNAAYWKGYGSKEKANVSKEDYEQAVRSEQPIIQRVTWDCDGTVSDLCLMGLTFPTDKSPLTKETGSRHAYTPVYSLLFSAMRHREIVVGEIGTLEGNGLKMFREFFPNASLYGFEGDPGMREICEKLELNDTIIEFIDVVAEDSIRKAFKNTGQKFDLIIDDSSHRLEDQLRIIENCVPFLRPGGYLVIEDIFDDERAPEDAFEAVVSELGDEIDYSTFILPKSRRAYTGGWNNEKLLVLVKSQDA